jgi:hypothetical protein
MKTIFISGSMSIKTLSSITQKTLDKLISKWYFIMVWDAYGIDLLVQEYLSLKNYHNVLICSISEPRVFKNKKFKNKIINYNSELKSERKKQTYKDMYMTENSDISLVIWDWISNWSYNNIIRVLDKKKEIKVILDDNFLDNISIDNINKIFLERHKYSLSEYIKKYKKDENYNITNVKQMRNILIDNKILDNENEYKIKYEKDIEIKIIRGNKVIRYSKNLLDKYFYNKITIKQTNLF